jgi:hypothetical protein
LEAKKDALVYMVAAVAVIMVMTIIGEMYDDISYRLGRLEKVLLAMSPVKEEENGE